MDTQRSPGRIAADSRLKWFTFVQGLEANDIVQDINEFFDLFAFVRMPAGSLLYRCDDIKDNPLQRDRVLFIDGLLKTADGLNMIGLRLGPVFEVEDFQA